MGPTPMQLSASSSATSGNGDYAGGSGSWKQGDWNVSTGSGSSVGMTSKTMLMVAAGLAVVWLISRRVK